METEKEGRDAIDGEAIAVIENILDHGNDVCIRRKRDGYVIFELQQNRILDVQNGIWKKWRNQK